MKPLSFLALIFALTLAGCRPPVKEGSLTATQASAERIAHLEQKVDLLQRVITSMERGSRPVPGRGTNAAPAVAKAPTNSTTESVPLEEVMTTLAADVAGLEEGEQTVNQQIQSIAEAIVALEQAVLALDAEMRQMRRPR